MPYSVLQGKTIQIGAMFYDVNGNVTVPPAATLTITYTTTSGTSTVTSIAMSPAGSAFTAPWNTGVAAIGFATLAFTVPASLVPIPDPIIRVT